MSYKKQYSKNKDTILLPHLKDAGEVGVWLSRERGGDYHVRVIGMSTLKVIRCEIFWVWVLWPHRFFCHTDSFATHVVANVRQDNRGSINLNISPGKGKSVTH